MKTYASPKEALLDHGRIKAVTRGRISSENHAWLEEQIAANVFSITGVKVVKNADKPVAVKSVNGPTEKVIAEFTILYHKDAYHAEGVKDGKTYGMAEVCNNCRVSLVQNVCENPTILRDIPVRIVPNANKQG